MSNTTPSLDPRVLRAVRHAERVMTDPAADLSVAGLARVAGMSPFHFHREFRAQVGEPALAWVRRIRIERAASLVAWSAWPIARVAQATGYQTQAAFTRAFTRRFGVPPGTFRAQRAQPTWLAAPGERTIRHAGAVDLVRRPERSVICARHVGPIADASASTAPLVAWMEGHGVATTEACGVLIFHDDDTIVDESRARVDIGVVTDHEAPPGLSRLTLPASDHAVAHLAGTLDELMFGASTFLYERLPASGLQPAAFETIVELPWATIVHAHADLAGALAGPLAVRVLQAVGAPGALLPA